MQTLQLSQLSINISKPMKMEFEDMEIRAMNVLTGLNSTGKSLALKCAWVMSYIGAAICALKIKEKGEKRSVGSTYSDIAEDMFNSTFLHNNMTGIIIAKFGEPSITVELKEGKIKNLTYLGLDNNIISPIHYMSSDMRTFDDMSKYLVIRSKIVMQEMVQHYRLYDIVMMENIIDKCPITVSPERWSFLESVGIHYKFDTINIDFEKNDFYAILKNDERLYLSTLSKGEQALINMSCLSI